MRLVTIGIITLVSSLFAENNSEETSLSSASADYNGNTLVLKGDVSLDHGLGKMEAQEAFLEKQQAGQDFPFSFIRLEKDVHVKTLEDAELKCERAEFDFLSLKGDLFPKPESKVAYYDKKAGVHLVSQKIALDIQNQGFNGKKTAYDVEKVHASGSVIVDYAQNFTLRAGHALYHKTEKKPGVTIYPKNESDSCFLTHEDDQLQAKLIHLDLKEARLLLQQPKGKLLSSLNMALKKNPMTFETENLVWDHANHHLSLQGKSYIEEPCIGNISSDKLLEITRSKTQQKTLLKSMRALGKIVFTYQDPKENLPHQLTCYGLLRLNAEQMRLSLESPTENGLIPADKQINYKDSEKELFANHAELEYALSKEKLQPVLLLLKGNVRLSSSLLDKPTLCGLADRIAFSLPTKTLILSANPGNKVLFWDEEQGLRLASQEIHITEDPTTSIRSVKGIGNVQFAFSQEENSLLRNAFTSYRSADE